MQEIIYGTGNPGKIAYMERALFGLPLEIISLKRAAREKGVFLPEIEETGHTLLENARRKAESYFTLLKSPVFSCDSGLYLFHHDTGEPLPDREQPGIHVRRRGEERLTDEELLAHYTGLVKKYGGIRARYQTAICLIWDEERREESMDEDLWGEYFLLTDTPHLKRMEGFPLDRISVEIETGKYYYDLEENFQDKLVSDGGFRRFFCHFLEKYNVK